MFHCIIVSHVLDHENYHTNNTIISVGICPTLISLLTIIYPTVSNHYIFESDMCRTSVFYDSQIPLVTDAKPISPNSVNFSPNTSRPTRDPLNFTPIRLIRMSEFTTLIPPTRRHSDESRPTSLQLEKMFSPSFLIFSIT